MNDRRTAMGRRLTVYRADLHIHTALSPCASEEMTPPAIVQAALKAHLDMIAISDHNAAGNIAAVRLAAEKAGGRLVVLPGIEITSAEEVHVLGLFPDLETAERVAAHLRSLLPPADDNYYAFFGEQPLLDAEGGIRGIETAALAAATPLGLSETVAFIHASQGIAIAAHIDRKAFGVFSQLGFFPRDAGFDGVEVSRHAGSESSRLEEFAALGLPLLSSSDAHYLDEIGAASTELRVIAPSFGELSLALTRTDDRSVARA